MSRPDSSRGRISWANVRRPALFFAIALIVVAALAFIAHETAAAVAQTSDPCAVHLKRTPTTYVVPSQILEQYKTYLADLAAFESQFSSTQTFYFTIVSAFIALFSIKEAIRPFRDFFTPAAIVVLLFVSVVSFLWSVTALQFRDVIRAKFVVLRVMESAYPDLYPLYTHQSNYLDCRASPWTSSIIGNQFALILLLAVITLAIAAAGIVVQIRAARLRRHRTGPDVPAVEPWLRNPPAALE
jgi:nitrogen fixation-related uncharacterized protein